MLLYTKKLATTARWASTAQPSSLSFRSCTAPFDKNTCHLVDQSARSIVMWTRRRNSCVTSNRIFLRSKFTNDLKKKREYIRKARAKKESGQEREGFPVTTLKLSKLAKYIIKDSYQYNYSKILDRPSTGLGYSCSGPDPRHHLRCWLLCCSCDRVRVQEKLDRHLTVGPLGL